MKHLKFSRLFAAAMLVACFAFAGCKPQVEEVTKLVAVRPIEADDTVIGTWASTAEKFIIGASVFQNKYYYEGWFDSYEGEDLYVAFTSEDAGYIYMKYTKAAMPDYTYSTTAPDVGKWYALSFKGLDTSSTPNKISIAGAYKEDGKTSCASLKEAISEFTLDNGYYAQFSDLVKE